MSQSTHAANYLAVNPSFSTCCCSNLFSSFCSEYLWWPLNRIQSGFIHIIYVCLSDIFVSNKLMLSQFQRVETDRWMDGGNCITTLANAVGNNAA